MYIAYIAAYIAAPATYKAVHVLLPLPSLCQSPGVSDPTCSSVGQEHCDLVGSNEIQTTFHSSLLPEERERGGGGGIINHKPFLVLLSMLPFLL